LLKRIGTASLLTFGRSRLVSLEKGTKRSPSSFPSLPIRFKSIQQLSQKITVDLKFPHEQQHNRLYSPTLFQFRKGMEMTRF